MRPWRMVSLDEFGKMDAAGTVVPNVELAQTLAAIRTSGPIGFYLGGVADKIAAYSATQGGAITADALRGYHAGRPIRALCRSVI